MLGVGYSLMLLLSARLVTAGANANGADSTACDADYSPTIAVSPPTATDRPLPRVIEMKRPSFMESWGRCASMTVFGVMVIAVLIELAKSYCLRLFSEGSHGVIWGLPWQEASSAS